MAVVYFYINYLKRGRSVESTQQCLVKAHKNDTRLSRNPVFRRASATTATINCRA